jgi:hypothetical protein
MAASHAGQHLGVEEVLSLADWRRRVNRLYEDVRSAPDPVADWGEWRAVGDRLFRGHPQSPRRRRARDVHGPRRLRLPPRGACPRRSTSGHSDAGADRRLRRWFGSTGWRPPIFRLNRDELELEVYWLSGYGGGILIPFRDTTSGDPTYGAGRYVWDSVKAADLGSAGGQLVLDVNFAYHPSCAYDPRWVCPLAPWPTSSP